MESADGAPDLHTDFVGLQTNWTNTSGLTRPRRYLDSAATTLAMRSALHKREQLLLRYGSPHTSLNAASELCVAALQWAQDTVLRFFGFPPEDYHCIFLGSGATAALNRAAILLSRLHSDRPRVVISLMEHHSNDLPHRAATQSVCHLPLGTDGSVDLNALEHELAQGHVGYVALTACSNVTGWRPPIAEIAAMVHRHGAHLLVDGAQMAVHQQLTAPHAIDAFVFCGHKAYAPGTPGVLIVRKSLYDAAMPSELGGGIVHRVSQHGFELATDGHQRTHAGTPDVLGAFQLASVLHRLMQHGFEKIVAHEQALTQRLMQHLQAMHDHIVVYGHPDPRQRAGVVSFNVRGLAHDVVAWALANCFHITVRNGCFCAQPYVRELLGLGQALDIGDELGRMPGMVRASIGLYTSMHDIDELATALADIAARPGHYLHWHQASLASSNGAPNRDWAAQQLAAICHPN